MFLRIIEDLSDLGLTVGKLYMVIEENEKYYVVLGDDERPTSLPKELEGQSFKKE